MHRRRMPTGGSFRVQNPMMVVPLVPLLLFSVVEMRGHNSSSPVIALISHQQRDGLLPLLYGEETENTMPGRD